MNKQKPIDSSLSFTNGLALLFIGLKLTNYISWSWFWVLSPLWIPITTMLLAILCASFLNNRLSKK